MESRLKTKIPYMQHAYVTLWYPCGLDTHLTFWLIFLGKACLDPQIEQLNPELYNPGHTNMDSVTGSPSHQSLHGAIRFVAYTVAHIESRLYGYMLSIFCRILNRQTHTSYMESWITTTHHLFKAKHQRASLNKHFLSYTSPFVDFYCKYMFVCWQVKICWASENICWARAFPIYLPGGNWIEFFFLALIELFYSVIKVWKCLSIFLFR